LNFKQLVAKYVTGNLTTDQLPGIAYLAMVEGLDSPSLCILAGLEKNEDFYVIDRYFKLALKELDISIPDRR
jgi:hypothetical protein